MVWDGGHVITTLVKHVDPDHDNPSSWGFRTAERVKEARQTNLSEVLRTLQPRTSCWGRIRLISKIILVVDGDGNSLLICLLRSISKFNASHHWLFYHPWHIGFDSVLVLLLAIVFSNGCLLFLLSTYTYPHVNYSQLNIYLIVTLRLFS